MRVNEVPERDRLGLLFARFLLVKDAFDRDQHRSAFPSQDDWLAASDLARWLVEDSGLAPGGLFGWRIGHSLWAGRTMLHPCAHVYVPNIIVDPNDPTKFIAVPADLPAG